MKKYNKIPDDIMKYVEQDIFDDLDSIVYTFLHLHKYFSIESENIYSYENIISFGFANSGIYISYPIEDIYIRVDGKDYAIKKGERKFSNVD